MKPSFTPPCPPAFKVDAGLGFKPPAERDPNHKAPVDKAPVVAVPPQTAVMSPDQVHPVIEALCLGLCLAGENGDTEAEEKFNKALLAFTELSYERGRFTRENELMRTDINWLRTQLTNLTERLPK